MSQYPSYGYGQYQGLPHPPPPPPNEYAYNPSQAAYPPPMPGYGSPHDPNAPPANYYAMAAHDYNSSIPVIPGLGIGGTPVAGAPYQAPAPPLPSWSQGHHHVNNMNQDVNSQFVAGMPNAPSQYQYSEPPQFNGPAEQSFHHSTSSYNNNNNNNNNSSQPPPPKSVPHLANESTLSSDEMEEGELSEGQFEDLYEQVDSSAKSKDTTIVPNVPSIPDESQPTSTVDTPSGGFYTQEEEASEHRNPVSTVTRSGTGGRNMNGHQERTDARERSGSYSPYLSPREIEVTITRTRGHQEVHEQTPLGPMSVITSNGQGRVPGLGQQAVNALTPNMSNPLVSMESATTQNQTTNGINNKINNKNNTANSLSDGFKSLAEAKKEAQKAILKLWPLGVRYKHYIDEGFDENVVKLLFTELHLDLSTGLPIQPEATQQETQQSLPEGRSSAAATSKSPITERRTLSQPENATKPSEVGKMDKSEERKDRIARLLAEKAAKGPAPAPAPVPARVPAPASSSTSVANQPPVSVQVAPTAPVPVVAAVSAQLIPQAQAWAPVPGTASASALAQAQTPSSVPAQLQGTAQSSVLPTVSAATNITTTVKSSAASTPTGPKKNKEEMARLLRQKMEALQKSRGLQKVDSGKPTAANSAGAEAATPVTSAPIPAVSANHSAANASPQEQSAQDKGPIPGLFLSGPPDAQPINVRKRPVATDFVDYSSSESRKRPFGQKRESSSLVIDVSDDSDDEEMDIDMDMDSPDETPMTIQRSNTVERKGPSLAEFPPLRDLSRRNVSSPASSATHTPSGAFMSAKERQSLAAKEKEIQEMRRKIAEFEAKQKAKKGSQTPNHATATRSAGNDSELTKANAPRGSSVSVDKVHAPSAQLISEAVSASVPKSSEPAPKETARADGEWSASSGGSRVETAQEEKKKKAAALREAREARMREVKARIEAEKARIREEEARMQEEEARLLAELDREDDDEERGSDDGNQSEHMSVDEEPEDETPKDVEPNQNREDHQAAVSPQASLPETQEEPSSSAPPVSTEADAPEAAASEEQDLPMSEALTSAIERTVGTSVAISNPGFSVASQQQVEDVSMGDQVEAVEQYPGSSLDNAVAEPSMTSTGEPGYEAPSELYEPVQVSTGDSVDHVAIPDSPEFSPEPADDISANASGNAEAHGGVQLVPATISDVPQSRDDTQEIEAPAASEPQQPAPAATKPSTSFVPYETPLRNFRAFKFHPDFNKLVPGGVKSLTYSNKIDPRKQLCPSELQGGSCQRGEACEFQHLNSIGVSDEQILVELGRSDGYTGEQKALFIKGLRELLQDFRANQVRDFDTIATGIIEFRARFLGDKSKILPLEGVTL